MPASKISLDNAATNKLFYFVANAVVYRKSDGRCLILKRDEREKVHPGIYATPGGKLEWNDLDMDNPTRINGEVLDFENAVENLLVREIKEEAGINVESELHYINSIAFIRPDGIPVLLTKFAMVYESGEVVLEEGAFTDYKWVNVDEVKKYTCIKGVDKEIARTIEMFK